MTKRRRRGGLLEAIERVIERVKPHVIEALHQFSREGLTMEPQMRCQRCGGRESDHCADWGHCHCGDATGNAPARRCDCKGFVARVVN